MNLRKVDKYCIAGIIFLLVIASFVDMQISTALFNPSSVYGLTLEAIGELPGMLICLFCTIALWMTRTKTTKVMNILKTCGYGVLLLSTTVMSSAMLNKYLGLSLFVGIAVELLLCVLFYYVLTKVKDEDKGNLRKVAIVGVFLFIFAILVVNLIKMGWGRERYRHMATMNDFTGFTSWFIPNMFTLDNEFMSFPSGHSANATVIIWITLIPLFVPTLKKYTKALYVVAIFWILLVTTSRIIMGAHFVSDVTMGVTITLIIFVLLKKKMRI